MQEKIEYSLTLEEVLNNKKYTVNYYQREYRWGRKQIEQLIDDLTNAFEDSNGKVKATELTDVEGFDYYYMGTIIVTGSQDVKSIIDGQQRLTSMTLLLIALNMPADMTKLKFEQIKAEVISSGETNLVKVYEQTINRLATFFDVTITSVKIRLLELGYDYLKGIHDYIDNSHTKSYLYNASKIKPEQSFSASFYDAVANGTINKQLRDCLEKRTIVYASGFFVINNKKYTYKDKETGKQELTDYALEHMDECCLVFNHERKNQNSFNDRYYSMCFLARSRGKEFNSNVNSADEHNSAILESASQLAELSDEIFEIQEANNFVRNMNGSFAESLAFLMKENGFSNNSLYSESYINDHKIAQFLSGEKEPTKGEVLAICAAMHLHPIVTHKLLEVAGKRLNLSTEMDGAYDFLIREYYDQGLDAWNAQLNAIEKVEWTLP